MTVGSEIGLDSIVLLSIEAVLVISLLFSPSNCNENGERDKDGSAADSLECSSVLLCFSVRTDVLDGILDRIELDLCDFLNHGYVIYMCVVKKREEEKECV